MAVMATFITDPNFNKKEIFRAKQLERIREAIGTNNPDQCEKEELLLTICSKITSVYIGCFDKIEQILGEEVWAYKVPPEEFSKFSQEEQEVFKRHFKLWNDCRLSIKDLGNKVIDDVIEMVKTLTLTKN